MYSCVCVCVCVCIQFHAVLSHVCNGGTATTSSIENRPITRSPRATLLRPQPLCFLPYSITQVTTNLFFISKILLFREYYIDRLLQYISFWGFFFSSIISLLRSFQVFTCISSHSFLLLRIKALEMAGTFRSTSTYLVEKAMATYSSTLAWKIPWMEKPGRLQSIGSRRVRHDWATSLSLSLFHHMDIPPLVYFLIEKHLDCFHFGDIMSKVFLDICVHIFVWI